ncbi:MAG: hypothetical protein WBC44_09440 [Planctomycetaceae bacterium]
MSVETVTQQVLDREPDLGAGDESRCLPGWIESFCRKWEAKEGMTLSHAAVGNLLHTMIAARRRTQRLVKERNEARGE